MYASSSACCISCLSTHLCAELPSLLCAKRRKQTRQYFALSFSASRFHPRVREALLGATYAWMLVYCASPCLCADLPLLLRGGEKKGSAIDRRRHSNYSFLFSSRLALFGAPSLERLTRIPTAPVILTAAACNCCNPSNPSMLQRSAANPRHGLKLMFCESVSIFKTKGHFYFFRSSDSKNGSVPCKT
jgi:hypothetical protein